MQDIVSIEGYKVRYNRKRYGEVVMLWADVKSNDGKWLSLGGPWNNYYPPEMEIIEAMEGVLGIKLRYGAESKFNPDTELERISDVIKGFLSVNGLERDGLIFYTPTEWAENGQSSYAAPSLIAAINIKSSPLYEIVNGIRPDMDILNKLNEFMLDAGYEIRPMTSWAVGIYLV